MAIKKKKIPSKIRQTIWNTYIGIQYGQGKCYCCDFEIISQANFHCGHIISEKEGGSLDIDNLRPICGNCNSSMGIENMYVFVIKNKLKGKILIEIESNGILPNKLILNETNISVIDDQSSNYIKNSVNIITKKSNENFSSNKGEIYNKYDIYKRTNDKKNYKCDKCDKLFRHLGDYKKHLKRKKPCKKTNHNDTDDMNLSTTSQIKSHCDNTEIVLKIADNNSLSPLECYACGKVFTRKDNLMRHLDKVCTAKNKIKNNTKEIELINELFNKISMMEKKMSEMYQTINKSNDKNNRI